MGKYLDKISQHERTQAEEALRPQKTLDPIPTVHPGDRITWQRAGTTQQGLVDFLHEEADGTRWAFCTQGATWAVVNLKFATVRTDADSDDTHYPPMSPEKVAKWREGT